MSKNKKSMTLLDALGGIIGILWLLGSAGCAWSVSTIGVAFGILVLIVLLFIGKKPISNRPKLEYITIRHVVILLGFLALAVVFIYPAIFAPIFEKHGHYFSIKAYTYNGFERLWKSFSQWSFADMLQFLFVPVFITASIVSGVGIFFFSLCDSETAEEKLLKHSARNKPKEAPRYNFSELKKIGYDREFVPLGVNLWERSGKQPIMMPFNVLNKHTMLVGTTGAGKTTTLYHFIVSALCHNKAIVFIDAKGDPGNIEKFKHVCKAADRKFHIVKLGGADGYNPLSVGTLDELKDKIIGMFDWSEDYYKESASRAIKLLIKIMRLTDIPVNMGNLVDYSDYDTLSEYVLRRKGAAPAGTTSAPPSSASEGIGFQSLPPPDQGDPGQGESHAVADDVSKLMAKLKSIDPKSRSGIRDRLAAVAEGDAAEMFTAPHPLNLSEAIEAGEAVLFSLDSLRFGELAQGFGRLIINDIRACISIHAELAMSRKEKPRHVTMIFDEFSVFASKQVVNIVNMSRSAGFEVLLSFQSLSDIDKLDHGADLRKQIIENCNSLIVQRQNEQEGREILAKTFGTRDSTKLTMQEDEGSAGAGSLREVQEFVVSPNDINNLQTGQAFVKIDVFGITKIQIPLQEQLL